jgi:hypothetical protein
MSMIDVMPVRAAALLLLSMLPGPAAAQSTGLEDMIGARAGQGELALARRGYVNVGGARGDDRAYGYWWNAERQQCVSIATMDGRYAAIQPTLPPDCGKTASLRHPSPARDGSLSSAQEARRSGDAGADAPVVDGRNVDLGLVCFGDGTRAGIASGTSWTWNREKKRYDPARYNETTTEMFDASLMVQTWTGGGRIRLPRALIPPLNSRGEDGWWALYDVATGPDVIRARYRLNGLNKPSLTIDRRTGRIIVEGTGGYGFRGTCDMIGHEARRF